jgi:hypothetical protein
MEFLVTKKVRFGGKTHLGAPLPPERPILKEKEGSEFFLRIYIFF